MQFKNYNIETVASLPFYSIPKILFEDDFFKEVSLEAKVLYSIMQNRVTLSQENNWVDNKGDIYIYMTLEEASETLNCSINTIRKAIKQLIDIGLLETVRQGLNKPNKIFVKSIIANKTIKKCKSEIAKNDILKNENLTGIKNDISNTDIRKNDVSVVNKDANNNFEKPYIKKYMNSIKPTASRWEIEQLSSYEDDLEAELIEIAIEQALLNNVPKLNYIKAILNNFLERQIFTVEKYKLEEEFRNNNKHKQKEEEYIPQYTEDDFTKHF